MRIYIHCASAHERRTAAGVATQLGASYDVIVPALDRACGWERLSPTGDVTELRLEEAAAAPLQCRRSRYRRRLIRFVSLATALRGKQARGHRLHSIVRFIELYGWRALFSLDLSKKRGARRKTRGTTTADAELAGRSDRETRPSVLARMRQAVYGNATAFSLLVVGVVTERKHLKRQASALLSLEADCMVMFEDNIGNTSRQIAVAAKQAGLNYIVLPTTIPNPIEPAHYYASDPRHSAGGPIGWLIRRFKPGWVFDYQGLGLLRLPATEIILYEITGLATRRPWLLNYGQAYRIAIDSQRIAQRYQALGFPPEQLETLGSPVDDVLFAASQSRAALREQLLAPLGLRDDRPLVLAAIPPNQFTAPSIEGFEYDSYEEMLQGWVDALAPLAQRANILAVKHPRTKAEEVQCFTRAGVPLVDAATETLLPLSDLYVASISATIRWALALGIPVINYDCYRYRYGDYAGASGLVEVEDRTRFEQALHDILDSPGRLDELGKRQKEQASEWGVVDGCFAARLRELLNRAARTKSAAFTLQPAKD